MMKVLTLTTIFFSFVLLSFSAQATEKNPILAQVNGVAITQEELDSKFQELTSQGSLRFRGSKANLLEDLVHQQLLSQEAKSQKLEEDQKVAHVLEQLKEELMIQRLIEKRVVEQVKVDEKDAQEYYRLNESEFVEKEKINPSHILVEDKAKAKKILKRLEKGEDFATLAKEVSVCPSSSKGGDLGWVSKGQMVPEFETAAFALKANELSSIVQTQFGFHLIKLNQKTEETQKQYKEVAELIKNQLLQEKQRSELLKYLQGLRKNADVKIYSERIE